MPSWQTLRELVVHFASRNQLVLVPLLLVLGLAGVLLLVSQGAANVAPFVYALF